MKVCIDFDYEPAGSVSVDSKSKLVLPLLPIEPGVYPFRLLGATEAISTYIGESDNLQRRARHYRSPGPSQMTNIRMHGRLLQHLGAGGTIEVSIVTRAQLLVGNNEVALDLARKTHRRLLENAALVSNPKAELIKNLSGSAKTQS